MSLKTKFSLFATLLIFLATGATVIFVTRFVESEIQREIELRGIAIARTLALNSEDPLALDDDLYLVTLLADAMKDPDVRYAMVVDTSGKIRAADNTDLWGKDYIPPSGASRILDDGIVVITAEAQGHNYNLYDIAVPVVLVGNKEKKRIGTVHLGISGEEIVKATRRVQATIGVIALVVFLIGILASMGFASLLTRPVFSLMDAVKELGKGNLNVSAKVMSSDEIGVLARTFNQMIASLREKEVIKDAFRRYVSRQVAEEIFKEPDRYLSALKGERKRVSVLFADIRGFTPMAEKMAPEKVVSILNEYLTYMTSAVFKYKGTLDKFIGDCVMAVYGAPLSVHNPTEMAVKTAVEIQKKVAELNSKRVSSGEDPVYVGIGINTGEVVVGNIGSSERMDYTVIGDNVNLAARIQAKANEMGVEILISGSAYDEVKDIVVARELPPVRVKGKTEPVRIYVVEGLRGGIELLPDGPF